LTEKTTPSQITNINAQIEKLKQQALENNTQIKKYIEKRDLYTKSPKAREEVKLIKPNATP
jgi:ribosomal protein L18E